MNNKEAVVVGQRVFINWLILNQVARWKEIL
jgi:hypothetical protein